MKILMLTPYLPYPLYSGGQIRSYNLIKNLSRKHEITLFSFIRNDQEKEYIPYLKQFCSDVRVFHKRPPWSVTSLTLSAFSVYPLVVCMYLKRSLVTAIREAIEQKKFDLIHAETFYVMPNIPRNSIPVILVEQTIEYLVYQHYTEITKLLPMKWIMNFDVVKIRYWEQNFWREATRVVAMSEADRKEMHKLIPELIVNLVPNGVDPEYFSYRRSDKVKKRRNVLFVGNFKWLQNREAVEILVRSVWPKIINKLPDAKLYIVGRYPTITIRNSSSRSIFIKDNVDDIRRMYRESDILLAPIYGPGGTRYKILESMATGLPVVTTPTGIEGLGAIDSKDVVICEEPDELADKTVKILTHQPLYNRLANNGRKLVEKKFNWKVIADSLDRIYEEAAYARKH